MLGEIAYKSPSTGAVGAAISGREPEHSLPVPSQALSIVRCLSLGGPDSGFRARSLSLSVWILLIEVVRSVTGAQGRNSLSTFALRGDVGLTTGLTTGTPRRLMAGVKT